MNAAVISLRIITPRAPTMLFIEPSRQPSRRSHTGAEQEGAHEAPRLHRQDVKQRQGIYSTLHWAGLGLLLSPPGGLAATNDASLDNSQFCFQKLVPVCNSSYLLISHGRPKPCSTRLVELLCPGSLLPATTTLTGMRQGQWCLDALAPVLQGGEKHWVF